MFSGKSLSHFTSVFHGRDKTMSRTILLSVLVAMAGIVSVAASGSMQTQSSPVLDLLKVGQVVAIQDGPGGYRVRIWSEEQAKQWSDAMQAALERARARRQVEQSDRKAVERQSRTLERIEDQLGARNATISSIGGDHIVFTLAHRYERHILKTAIVEVSKDKKRPDAS
jgi:preprotein translocase subunit SecD